MNFKIIVKVYKSEKCQKFFKDPIKYVSFCSEAIGYNTISQLNNMDETISDYDKACEKANKKVSISSKYIYIYQKYYYIY